MTATNHAVTGALVAVVVNQPLLAVPIAFLSHFVMDAIPHFGINLQTTNRPDADKLVNKVIIGDIILATFLLILLPMTLGSAYTWWVVMLCMIVCMLPDLVWGWQKYFGFRFKQQPLIAWFIKFHSKIQWSESVRGAIVEVVWFIAAISLIVYFYS